VHSIFARYTYKRLEKLAPLFIINQSTGILPPYTELEIETAEIFINNCWTITYIDMVEVVQYIDRHFDDLTETLLIPQYGEQ